MSTINEQFQDLLSLKKYSILKDEENEGLLTSSVCITNFEIISETHLEITHSGYLNLFLNSLKNLILVSGMNLYLFRNYDPKYQEYMDFEVEGMLRMKRFSELCEDCFTILKESSDSSIVEYQFMKVIELKTLEKLRSNSKSTLIYVNPEIFVLESREFMKELTEQDYKIYYTRICLQAEDDAPIDEFIFIYYS